MGEQCHWTAREQGPAQLVLCGVGAPPFHVYGAAVARKGNRSPFPVCSISVLVSESIFWQEKKKSSGGPISLAHHRETWNLGPAASLLCDFWAINLAFPSPGFLICEMGIVNASSRSVLKVNRDHEGEEFSLENTRNCVFTSFPWLG